MHSVNNKFILFKLVQNQGPHSVNNKFILFKLVQNQGGCSYISLAQLFLRGATDPKSFYTTQIVGPSACALLKVIVDANGAIRIF